MIDPKSTSYPWLSISQLYEVPYEAVLALVDDLDRGAPCAAYLVGNPDAWIVETVTRWKDQNGIAPAHA